MLYALVAAALIVLDQLVKYWVHVHIPVGGFQTFLPGILGLTNFENNGAAFSSLIGMRWILISVTLVFLVAMGVVLRRRMITHPMGLWSLTAVMAGATGNLIDRIRFGYVVDMFQPLFMRFAIFNVADICIVCGGIVLCVYLLFFYERFERKGQKEHERDA